MLILQMTMSCHFNNKRRVRLRKRAALGVIFMRRLILHLQLPLHDYGYCSYAVVVSRFMRKFDSGIWQKSITGGLRRPLGYVLAVGAQRVKGGGTPLVLPLTLCDLTATYTASSSCSIASRCFMFMYFLQPHWVPATWRSLAQTSISAEFPSGKAPTTRVLRRISRFIRSITLLVRIRVQCSLGKSQ